VVADHTKWGVVGISTIADLEDADVVVTDSGLHPDALAVLTERVGDVMVAPTAATLPSREVS
jgi:DeoR/GlpR family transcriptional regulator of sugar metabolism